MKLTIEDAKKSRELRDKFIEENIRLAYYVSKQHYYLPMDREDIISASLIGLVKSVDTFNLEKKYKFATYAATVMRNEILMELRKHNRRRKLDTISLDFKYGVNDNKEDMSLMDIIPIEEPLYKFEDYELSKYLMDRLKKKDERLYNIFIDRYVNKIKTNDLGKKYGITQSYATRLIQKAERELKKYTEMALSK